MPKLLTIWCILLYPAFLFSQSTSLIDSLEARLTESDVTDVHRVELYNELTRQYSQVDQMKAVAYADSAYALATDLGDQLKRARALINKGGMLPFLGRFDEADSLLDVALSFDLDASDEWTELQTNAYVNKGNIRFFTGRYDSALVEYEFAIGLAKANRDTNTWNKALHNKAGIELTQSKYQLALTDYLSARKLSEAMGNNVLLSQQLGNISSIYLNLDQYQTAIRFSKEAIEIAKEIGSAYILSACYNNLGSSFERMDQLDSAIHYNLKALEIKQKLGDTRGKAIVTVNLGLAYNRSGELDKAVSYLQEALQSFEAEQNPEGIAMAKIGLGVNAIERGKITEGRNLYEEGVSIAKKAGLPTVIEDGLFGVSNAYASQKKYEQAYQTLLYHKQLSDSLALANNMKNLDEIRTIYEAERSEKEILRLEKESETQRLENEKKEAQLERERTVQYALGGGIALALLFGGVIFNRFRVTQRQKNTIEKQKLQVETAHQEIQDSIAYAKRIQTAILPPDRIVKEYLSDSFILYKPKDVVAGDFYWMETVNDTVYFAAADCTGHGVPGAMVSVVCVNGLNRAVREFGLREPGKILDRTRELVIKEFEKSEEEVKDGMDISLCALNTKTNELHWAGAHNPLWIATSRQLSTVSQHTQVADSRQLKADGLSLYEIKADKQPIGQYHDSNPFTTHTLQLEKGDTIYVFSDGYPDQFGGEKGKKYKSGNFKKKLLELSQKPIDEQRKLLDEEFEQWRGDLEQIDDVCVIGVRIS